MTDPTSPPPEEADPPPARSPLHYPVTAGVGAIAVVVSLAWWSGSNIDNLVMDIRAWRGEPWRMVTSVFPHVDFIHLAFNLYWLWVFGSRVEDELGHWATAGIMLLLGVGPALAEYALFHGGVGLSGIGYGLFGLLWALGPRDERFAGIVDARVTNLFLGWFVLCCVLTAADVWRVGNAAHAAGAVLGALLGLAMGERRRARRLGFAGLLVPAVALTVAGATVGRGVVNLAGQAGHDLAYLGYLDLEKGDNERAAVKYREALRLNGRQADWWINLGIACQHLGRHDEAVAAYSQAREIEPDTPGPRRALANARGALAYREQTAGRLDQAARLYREALAEDEGQAELWYNLGLAYTGLGQLHQARDAYQRAVALRPGNEQYRAALAELGWVPGGKK